MNQPVSSFKDLIEKRAAEMNLLFLPVQNKFKDNKQIYRFGNLNIYIDRNVVFVLQNGNWMPSSINELVKKAR
jgi:tuftelin-interacting protein 11